MRRLALPLLALLAVPGAQACSLIAAEDLQATWLGRDALVTNVQDRIVRIGFDGKVTGLHTIQLQAWRAPVADPEGRRVALNDQQGLGADCSGRTYTLLLDARTGNLTRSWEPSLGAAASTPGGFLAFHDGWWLHGWTNGEARQLSRGGEQGPVAPAVAGGRFAWIADREVRLTSLEDGATEARWDLPEGTQAAGIALAPDGTAAVLAISYQGDGEVLQLLVEGKAAWSQAGRSGYGPHPLVAFDGGWLLTNGTAAWFVEAEGAARIVARGASLPAVAVDPDGARAAIVLTEEGRAREVRLVLPGLTPGPVLRPQGSGWAVTAPEHPPPGTQSESRPAPGLGILAAGGLLAAAILARRR